MTTSNQNSQFSLFAEIPVSPMHLAQPSAGPMVGGGAPEHALRTWTTFPFHLMVATFSHVPPSSSQAGAVPPAARRRGAAARAWAPEMP